MYFGSLQRDANFCENEMEENKMYRKRRGEEVQYTHKLSLAHGIRLTLTLETFGTVVI